VATHANLGTVTAIPGRVFFSFKHTLDEPGSVSHRDRLRGVEKQSTSWIVW